MLCLEVIYSMNENAQAWLKELLFLILTTKAKDDVRHSTKVMTEGTKKVLHLAALFKVGLIQTQIMHEI